jgi:2-dehydropantoate 2-reductase
MWEKWIVIATGAGITCLMRAAVGDIVAADAAGLVTKLLEECAAIAVHQGFPPHPEFLERTRQLFTTPSSLLTTSMLRDIERGAPIEADHLLGDLLRRASAEERDPAPLLKIVCAHLGAYEARRVREQTLV